MVQTFTSRFKQFDVPDVCDQFSLSDINTADPSPSTPATFSVLTGSTGFIVGSANLNLTLESNGAVNTPTFDEDAGTMTYDGPEEGTVVNFIIRAEDVATGCSDIANVQLTIASESCPGSPQVTFLGAPTGTSSSDSAAMVTPLRNHLFIDFEALGLTNTEFNGAEEVIIEVSEAGQNNWRRLPNARRSWAVANRWQSIAVNGYHGSILPDTDYDVRLSEAFLYGTSCEGDSQVQTTVTTLSEPTYSTATEVNVSNFTELVNAVQNWSSGQTIVLAGGNYNVSSLSTLASRTGRDNIAMVCPTNNATISGYTTIAATHWFSTGTSDVWSCTVGDAVNQGNTTVWHNDQHLIRTNNLTQLISRPSGYTTDGVTAYVKIPGTGTSSPPTIVVPVTHRGLSFISCDNVYFKGIKFEGFARDPGPGNPFALFFQNCLDVTIDGCEFTKSYIGVQLDQNCSRFLAKNCSLYDGLDHSGFHGLKQTSINTYQYESLSTIIATNTDTLKQVEVKNCRWEETPNGCQIYDNENVGGDQAAWAFHNCVHEKVIDGFEPDGGLVNVVFHDNTNHGSQAKSLAPAIAGVTWMFNNQFNWGWRAPEDIIGFSSSDPRTVKECIHLTYLEDEGPPELYGEIGSLVIINNTFVATTAQRNGKGLTGQSFGQTGGYFLMRYHPNNGLPVKHMEFQNNICVMKDPSTIGPPEGAFWANDGKSHVWSTSRIYRRNNTYYTDGPNASVYLVGGTKTASQFRSYVVSQGQNPDIFENSPIEGLDPLLNASQLPSRTDVAVPIDGFSFINNGATLVYDQA